jgi:multidrug transporter EmrE-like cation transporter
MPVSKLVGKSVIDMSLVTLFLIIVSVSLSAVAQICFKLGLNSASADQERIAVNIVERLAHVLLTPGVIVGLACYGFGTLLWLSALGRVQLSQAYPFVGLGFALTAVAGHVLFNDTLSAQRLIGIALVSGGIFLVARS